MKKVKQMTEKETRQTKELADIIVEKFRTLIALESKILEATEAVSQQSVTHNSTEPLDSPENPALERRDMLTALESELKTQAEEMVRIIGELQSATPYFSAYVLPQIGEIVETLKAGDVAELAELTRLVAALVDADSPQSLELLEAIIITRLRDNLEKTFGI